MIQGSMNAGRAEMLPSDWVAIALAPAAMSFQS